MVSWVMMRLVVVGLCIYGEKWDCTLNSGIRTLFSGIVIFISGIVNENSGMSYPLLSISIYFDSALPHKSLHKAQVNKKLFKMYVLHKVSKSEVN